MRPKHLSVVLKGAPVNRTDRAGVDLTRVVYLMTRWEVPEAMSPFLCGARIHATVKKDGGLRPIAVGNMIPRLTSKLIASDLVFRVSLTDPV